MPMPPPPVVLFTITGQPIASAARRASSGAPSGGEPGSSGTPAARASSRAASLRPKARICSGEGPQKRIPASSTAAANSGSSLRNP